MLAGGGISLASGAGAGTATGLASSSSQAPTASDKTPRKTTRRTRTT